MDNAGAIHIEAQGRVLKVSHRQDNTDRQPPPPSRGDVSGFSRKSRKRLLDLFNRFEFNETQTKFITLTFAGMPRFDEAKAALRRFTMRLKRKHEDAAAVWRMELQERGSVHFHLVTFGMPYYKQKQLQAVWTQCTQEERSIVDIRKVESHSQLIGYVSKYIAKAQDALSTTSLDEQPYLHGTQPNKPGRWWGVHNRDCLPFAEYRETTITSQETYRYLRWAIKAMSNGYAAGNRHGTTLWHEDCYRMIERVFYLDVAMEDRPGFERQKWLWCKHGARTVQALSEIDHAWHTVGESVKTVTEALCLLAHRMPTATPKERLNAAHKMCYAKY